MGYDSARPADDDYISVGPGVIRENQEALKTGGIVNAGTLNGKSAGNSSGQIPISNGELCVNLNADKFDGKDAGEFAGAGHSHNVATTNDDGFMSNTDKQKLNGIAAGAEVNQNAFSAIAVRLGGIFYHLFASSKTDTWQLLDGANITLTPDTVNKTVTIGVSGTVQNAANAGFANNAYECYYLHLPGGAYYGPSSFALAGHTTHTGEALSLNSPGYKKFADGLIIQWEGFTLNAGSSASKAWPLAFPNQCFSVAIAPRENGGSNINVSVVEAMGLPARIGITLKNSGADNAFAYIIAIGY